jgi:hypothetical protein
MLAAVVAETVVILSDTNQLLDQQPFSGGLAHSTSKGSAVTQLVMACTAKL